MTIILTMNSCRHQCIKRTPNFFQSEMLRHPHITCGNLEPFVGICVISCSNWSTEEILQFQQSTTGPHCAALCSGSAKLADGGAWKDSYLGDPGCHLQDERSNTTQAVRLIGCPTLHQLHQPFTSTSPTFHQHFSSFFLFSRVLPLMPPAVVPKAP